MNYVKAMEERKSVRNYEDAEVEEAVVKTLEASLSRKRPGISSGSIRFSILTAREAVKEARTGFLYGIGKINAPAIIVGICEKPEDQLEIGFLLEREVLYLTEKGYGTCFLGTFQREALRTLCHLSDTEQISVVVAFGKKKSGTFLNGGFRTLAGSTKRKNYREILWNAAEFSEASPLIDAVKHAIMAPSGNNRQPVRVLIKGTAASFYYEKGCELDAGIFMAHFYLYCLDFYDKVMINKRNDKPEYLHGLEAAGSISWQEGTTCH